jgi:hypothetical protein
MPKEKTTTTRKGGKERVQRRKKGMFILQSRSGASCAV